MSKSILEVFAKNRAEELPEDLWGQFVLPLDFESIALKEKKKASVIVGGRGTGKTMFIKYHCHATQLSPKRREITREDLSFLGIHWRPDTAFTPNINPNWVGKYWESVFNSLMSVSILIEFSRLINNIYLSNIDDPNLKANLQNFLIPTPIKKALSIEETNFISSEEYFQDALFEITNWIRMPSSETPPFSLDLKQTALLVIQKLKSNCPQLNDSLFHIFIDEFENLSSEQQKIINSWLKHGHDPLLFSIAYKKYANVTSDTKTQEKLEERDDYRLIDVEKIYFNSENPKSFEILAAELLLLKLSDYLDMPDMDKVIKAYSEVESIELRKQPTYQAQIKKIIEHIFPSQSQAEISRQLLSDSTLLNKLKSTLIEDALKKNGETELTSLDFINSDYPEASIINGVLLHRTRVKPIEIKQEFDSLIALGSNAKYKQWIQNNLYGALLYLYNTLPQRVSPTYAGFSEFILMSKGNLRHFLELCFQSLSKAQSESNLLEDKFISSVPIETQSKATLTTSTNQLGKIINSGANGKYLQKIAYRLGIIFSQHQKRKSQSEPEVNHFSIDISDVSLLNEKVQQLLNESLVWSVLIPYRSTKNKSESDIEQIDYLLHPVLSCHFGISPRKKRKIKFMPEQLEVIFLGRDEDFNSFLDGLRKKLRVDDDNSISDTNSQYSLTW
ncbi:hypothetical protein ACFSJY_05210 [Thalassotalea euphylliae]|uniref:ORC-CDC6 family AAA ATPase n=1 Tax=Thalassotalea euphylliae TaxID=1655234 RepID=UPI00363A1D07